MLPLPLPAPLAQAREQYAGRGVRALRGGRARAGLPWRRLRARALAGGPGRREAALTQAARVLGCGARGVHACSRWSPWTASFVNLKWVFWFVVVYNLGSEILVLEVPPTPSRVCAKPSPTRTQPHCAAFDRKSVVSADHQTHALLQSRFPRTTRAEGASAPTAVEAPGPAARHPQGLRGSGPRCPHRVSPGPVPVSTAAGAGRC